MLRTIKTTNFLGARLIDVALDKVNLFCGDNAAGKSSLQQAVRYALTGEITRVKLKSDFGLLVTEGANEASIEIVDDDGVVYSPTIKATGKRSGESNASHPALPFLLDQSRFCEAANSEQRKELLFAIATPDIDKDKIEEQVKLLKGNVDLLPELFPLLSIGNFTAAHQACEDKAKEYRAEWKGITGETYGADKAASWEPSVDGMSEIKKIAKELDSRDETYQQAAQALLDHSAKVSLLREKLAIRKVELQCECGKTVKFSKKEISDAELELHSAVETMDYLEQSMNTALELWQQSQKAEAQLAELENYGKAKKKDAAKAHQMVSDWVKMKELFAPSGVPSYFISPIMKQFNGILQNLSLLTGWHQVVMRDDGEIQIAGRPYQLACESERWRGDAMVCHALSVMSGSSMPVVLDRVDILSVKQRAPLLKMALNGECQYIMFATLKEKPAINGVTAFWMNNGEIEQ